MSAISSGAIRLSHAFQKKKFKKESRQHGATGRPVEVTFGPPFEHFYVELFVIAWRDFVGIAGNPWYSRCDLRPRWVLSNSNWYRSNGLVLCPALMFPRINHHTWVTTQVLVLRYPTGLSINGRVDHRGFGNTIGEKWKKRHVHDVLWSISQQTNNRPKKKSKRTCPFDVMKGVSRTRCGWHLSSFRPIRSALPPLLSRTTVTSNRELLHHDLY